MEKGRFREQAERAKEFYENEVLSSVEGRTDSQKELLIMTEKLNYHCNFSNSIFVHLGAGTGRHIKELHEIFNPKESIAVEIADRNMDIISQKFNLSSANISLLKRDFFKIDFSVFQTNQLFVFLNWTTLAEVGSQHGLSYLLKSIYKFPQQVTILGDMPFQESYSKEIIEYHSRNLIKDLGILLAPSDNNQIGHVIYIPTESELATFASEIGFIAKPIVPYVAKNGLKRYFFEFRKEKD